MNKTHSSKVYDLPKISLQELIQYRNKTTIQNLKERSPVMEILLEMAKDINKQAEIINKLLFTTIFPLIQHMDPPTKLDIRGAVYGLKIMHELARNHENHELFFKTQGTEEGRNNELYINTDFGREEIMLYSNPVYIVFKLLSNTASKEIIQMSISCLKDFLDSIPTLDVYCKLQIFEYLTFEKLLVVIPSTQKDILEMWELSVNYDEFSRILLSEDYKYCHPIIVCLQSPSTEVTLSVLRILRKISGKKLYQKELNELKVIKRLTQVIERLFESYDNNELESYREEEAEGSKLRAMDEEIRQGIKKEIACIFKNMFKYLKYIYKYDPSLSIEKFLPYVRICVRLANEYEKETKLFAITALVHLSADPKFHSMLLEQQAFELLSSMINESKLLKHHREVCRFFVHINSEGQYTSLLQREPILRFLFENLNSADELLRKYTVKVLSELTESQEVLPSIRPYMKLSVLVRLMDFGIGNRDENNKDWAIHVYAAKILGNISEDVTLHNEFIHEPEISSIKHALTIGFNELVLSSLSLLVSNLSKNEQNDYILFCLYKKNFLESLITLLQNLRKNNSSNYPVETYLRSSKVYSSLVHAISQMCRKFYCQQIVMNTNAFRDILLPLCLADEADQLIVGISICQMLFGGIQIQTDFIKHNGINSLNYFLGKSDNRLFLHLALKSYSLLSQNFQTLNIISSDQYLIPLMKKFMLYKNLSIYGFPEIQKIFINNSLWDSDLRENPWLLPMYKIGELGLLVKNGLINALSLFLFNIFSERRTLHPFLLSNGIVEILHKFSAHSALTYHISELKQRVPQLFLRLVSNISQNPESHMLLINHNIFEIINKLFSCDSMEIMSSISLILTQFAQYGNMEEERQEEYRTEMIKHKMNEVMGKVLCSPFKSLYMEATSSLNFLLQDRSCLPQCSTGICPLIDLSHSNEHNFIKRSLNLLAALSFYPPHHSIFIDMNFFEHIYTVIQNHYLLEILIPLCTIAANISTTKPVSQIAKSEFCAQIFNLIQSDDVTLNQEVCKFIANETMSPTFDPSLLSNQSIQELQVIISREKYPPFKSLLGCLMSIVNLSSQSKPICKSLIHMRVHRYLENIILITPQHPNSGEVCAALLALANLIVGEEGAPHSHQVLNRTIFIMNNPLLFATKIALQKYLVYAGLKYFYNSYIKNNQIIKLEQAKDILELTGGISYKDIFIKEITLNISAAVSRNQELCNTLLLNRGYLHKIFTLFDSFESTIIHYYSIITLANITSYDDFNLTFLQDHTDKFFNLDEHLQFGNKEHPGMAYYLLNFVLLALKYEKIRNAAATPKFAEAVINLVGKKDMEEFYGTNQNESNLVLINILYYLSFSHITHTTITKNVQALQILGEIYSHITDKQLKNSMEILFCNMSFTPETHQSLLEGKIFDIFKNYVDKKLALKQPFEKSPSIQFCINFAENQENIELLSSDYQLIIYISTLDKSIKPHQKISLLHSYSQFLIYSSKNLRIHNKKELYKSFEKYVLHILKLLKQKEDNEKFIIDILFILVSNLAPKFYEYIIQMDDLWNSCLQTLDKQGPNMINLTADAQILSEIDDYAISAFGQRMKIIEILLMLSQNEKFFDIEINKYLNSWIIKMIEVGEKILRLGIQNYYKICISTYVCVTKYAHHNRQQGAFLPTIVQSNLAHFILLGLALTKNLNPKVNIQSFSCLANYSNVEVLMNKMNEIQNIAGASVAVYFAYKPITTEENFADYIINIIYNLSYLTKFHYILAQKKNIITVILNEALSGKLQDQKIKILKCIKNITENRDIVPGPGYKSICLSLTDILQNSELSTTSEIEDDSEVHKLALKCLSNISISRNYYEIPLEKMLSSLNQVYKKYPTIFFKYVPLLITEYMNNLREETIIVAYPLIIAVLNNLVKIFGPLKINTKYKKLEATCKSQNVILKIVGDNSILSKLYYLLEIFSETEENKGKIAEIFHIIEHLSSSFASHEYIFNKGIIQLGLKYFQPLRKMNSKGIKPGIFKNDIQVMSSIFIIMKNIFRKSSNDQWHLDILKKFKAHNNLLMKIIFVLNNPFHYSNREYYQLLKIPLAFSSILHILKGFDLDKINHLLVNSALRIIEFTNIDSSQLGEDINISDLYGYYIKICIKILKWNKEMLSEHSTYSLMMLSRASSEILTTTSLFDLFLLLLSLPKFNVMLNFNILQGIFNIFANLKSTENSIVTLFGIKLIQNIIVEGSPDLWQNSPLFSRICTKLILILKEYYAVKKYKDVDLDIICIILQIYQSMLNYSNTIQYLMKLNIIKECTFIIADYQHPTISYECAKFIWKTANYPACFPSLLKENILLSLLKVLLDRTKAEELQRVITNSLRRILELTGFPIKSCISQLILVLSEQFRNSDKSSWLINLIIFIEIEVRNYEVLDKSEQDLLGTIRNNCFLALTNLMTMNRKIGFTNSIFAFFMEFNYNNNIQFLLRFVYLTHTFLSKIDISVQCMPILMNTLLSLLHNAKEILPASPRDLSIPTTHSGGFFFEQGESSLLESEAKGVSYLYILSIISSLSLYYEGTASILSSTHFSNLYDFFKLYGSPKFLCQRELELILNAFLNAVPYRVLHSLFFQNPKFLIKLLRLGLAAVRVKANSLVIQIAKIITEFCKNERTHGDLIRSGYLLYLSKISEIYMDNEEILELTKSAKDMLEASATPQAQRLLRHEIIEFFNKVLEEADLESRFEDVGEGEVALEQGFIPMGEMNRECLPLLVSILDKNSVQIPGGNLIFQEGIIMSLLHIIQFLCLHDETYIWDLLDLPFVQNIGLTLQNIPNSLLGIAKLFNSIVDCGKGNAKDLLIKAQLVYILEINIKFKEITSLKGAEQLMNLLVKFVRSDSGPELLAEQNIFRFLAKILNSAYISSGNIFQHFSECMKILVRNEMIKMEHLNKLTMNLFQELLEANEKEYNKLGCFALSVITEYAPNTNIVKMPITTLLLDLSSSSDHTTKLMSLSAVINISLWSEQKEQIGKHSDFKLMKILFRELSEGSPQVRYICIRAMATMGPSLMKIWNLPIFQEKEKMVYLDSHTFSSATYSLNKPRHTANSIIRGAVTFAQILGCLVRVLCSGHPEIQYFCVVFLSEMLIQPQNKYTFGEEITYPQSIKNLDEEHEDLFLIKKENYANLCITSFALLYYKYQIFGILMKILLDTEDQRLRKVVSQLVLTIVIVLNPIQNILNNSLQEIFKTTQKLCLLSISAKEDLGLFLTKHKTNFELIEDDSQLQMSLRDVLVRKITERGTGIENNQQLEILNTYSIILHKAPLNIYERFLNEDHFLHCLEKTLESVLSTVTNAEINPLTQLFSAAFYEQKELISRTFFSILLLSELEEKKDLFNSLKTLVGYSIYGCFKLLYLFAPINPNLAISQLILICEKSLFTNSVPLPLIKQKILGIVERNKSRDVNLGVFMLKVMLKLIGGAIKTHIQVFRQLQGGLEDKIRVLCEIMMQFIDDQEMVNLFYYLLKQMLISNIGLPQILNLQPIFMPLICSNIIVYANMSATSFLLDLCMFNDYEHVQLFNNHQTQIALTHIKNSEEEIPTHITLKIEKCLEQLTLQAEK